MASSPGDGGLTRSRPCSVPIVLTIRASEYLGAALLPKAPVTEAHCAPGIGVWKYALGPRRLLQKPCPSRSFWSPPTVPPRSQPFAWSSQCSWPGMILSLGDFRRCLETSPWPGLGEGCYWHLVGGGRDAGELPPGPRTTHSREPSSPQCQQSQGQEPWPGNKQASEAGPCQDSCFTGALPGHSGLTFILHPVKPLTPPSASNQPAKQQLTWSIPRVIMSVVEILGLGKGRSL